MDPKKIQSIIKIILSKNYRNILNEIKQRSATITEIADKFGETYSLVQIRRNRLADFGFLEKDTFKVLLNRAQINFSSDLELMLYKEHGSEKYNLYFSELRKKGRESRSLMYLQVLNALRMPTTEPELRHILEIDNSASVRYTRNLMKKGLVMRIGKSHDRVNKPEYVSTIKYFSIEYAVGNSRLKLTTRPRLTKRERQGIKELF